MKYIVSAIIWTGAVLYFFPVLAFVALVSYIMPIRKADPLFKFLFRFLFKFLMSPVTVHNQPKLDPNKPYIFMANHTSMFDVPLMGGFVPTFIRGVEAHSHFSWPIYGWAVKRYGNIPIERTSARNSFASIQKAVEYLKDGNSIAIFPEGGRTFTGELLPLKKMPFYLAKEAGVDIVPMRISGLFELKSKNSWLISPQKIEIKYGEIIPKEVVEANEINQLRDLTRTKIEQL